MNNNFFEDFKIHKTYYDFFDQNIILEIEKILKIIEKESYTPSRKNIFKALQTDLNNHKVLLLGMDPYPQKGVATGLAFQVNINDWSDKRVNTSLKNILKLLYKTYYGEFLPIDMIRNKIENNEFKILPPDQLFYKWEKEGVLLLNAALTTKIAVPGAHIVLWKNVIIKLIEYIDKTNPNLIWLLWGTKAQAYEKYIINGTIIKHNHPAICGKLDNPNDFFNGNSFSDTMNLINWL